MSQEEPQHGEMAGAPAPAEEPAVENLALAPGEPIASDDTPAHHAGAVAPEAAPAPEEPVAPEAAPAPDAPVAPEAAPAPDAPVAPEAAPTPDAEPAPPDAADDLDEAIAQLGPPPEPTASPAAPSDVTAAVDDGRAASAPVLPFALYVVVWLAFAAFIVWRFLEVPADTALYEVPLYQWIVITGVALTALGPLLAVAVWGVSIRRPDADRGALFASALFKGAIATFAGVSIWWASLLILDQLRIGSLL